MTQQELNVLNEDFFGNAAVRKLVGLSPLKLDSGNRSHIIIFRRILEISITQGRWNCQFPQLS